jgi:hypothetical protein
MQQLTPDGNPPSRFARWCPACRSWYTHTGSRRCGVCGTALVRQAKIEKPKPGELRPGIVAEFADPRDRYDPARELATLRARLQPHRV